MKWLILALGKEIGDESGTSCSTGKEEIAQTPPPSGIKDTHKLKIFGGKNK